MFLTANTGAIIMPIYMILKIELVGYSVNVTPYTTHNARYALEEYREWNGATKCRSAKIYRDNMEITEARLEIDAALPY
jgi:hypothetical protein